MSLAPKTDLVPVELIERVKLELADLPEHELQTFLLRLERWWRDLLEGLAKVYPVNPLAIAEATVLQVASAYRHRDPDLKLRDQQRTLNPDWFQRTDMIGYAAYADRFAGPLNEVGEHIDHLAELGVSYLHLMPLLQPRSGPNDGGYAVADYRAVRSDLGTMDDLRALTKRLHGAGISLCLDLVLNHVAREHEWAAKAIAGDERYRNYFRIYPDRIEPDAFEATLPEVFPDFAPGNFTWDEDLDGWIWTTFNSYQWDLNWENPQVFAEMLDVVLFLANAGVDVLRLDAIAFIWKRLGTNCQNQPEVHAITQALRTAVRIGCPAVLFLAEAIVAPSDLINYLGQESHHGKVSDLAYHNSLMVQIWSMMAARDVRLAVQALGAIPTIPTNTAWLTYVRCHDDIGWAIEDKDAGAVGLSGYEHRAFLSDFYSGMFPGSFAEGLVFQFNPETGDRRISGSLASLAGLDQALTRRDVSRAKDAVARMLMAYALVCFWGGIPVLWYGDEIATPNDRDWAADPEHADDNRWVHRPVLDWDALDSARNSTATDDFASGTLVPAWPGEEVDQASASQAMWHGLRRVLRARINLPNLHAGVTTEVMSTPDPGVLAVRRNHPLGVVVGLFNVTETPRVVSANWLFGRGVDLLYFIDAISGQPPEQDEQGTSVRLAPYGVVWLVARPQ